MANSGVMLRPKLLFFISFEVFIVGFLMAYYDVTIEVPSVADFTAKWFNKGGTRPSKKPSPSSASKATLFTADQLREYDGKKGAKGLYLAILGKVFDVHKGSKHYGPNGGYHFFAAKDATRAFVSGDFTDKGADDDVTGLGHQDILGIEEWIEFYEKAYLFVGYLVGSYYTAAGHPTPKLKAYQEMLLAAKRWQQSQKDENQRFPPCNVEWSQGKGSRVWCTDKSGGINRDWVGVPRKLFKPGSSQSRCACIKDSGPPSDADPQAPHKNRGDLDNPNLQPYDNCNPVAISCNFKDND